mgnify:CR=1 FL=1
MEFRDSHDVATRHSEASPCDVCHSQPLEIHNFLMDLHSYLRFSELLRMLSSHDSLLCTSTTRYIAVRAAKRDIRCALVTNLTEEPVACITLLSSSIADNMSALKLQQDTMIWRKEAEL